MLEWVSLNDNASFAIIYRTFWFSSYSVSQKNPPLGDLEFFHFFHGGEFLIDFLHTYYTFLSTLHYKFLFNYP